MSIYQKGKDIFERLANRGVDLFEDKKLRDIRRLQNLFILGGLFFYLLIIPGIVITYISGYYLSLNGIIDYNLFIKNTNIIIIPIIILMICYVLCYYFQKYSKSIDGLAFISASAGLFPVANFVIHLELETFFCLLFLLSIPAVRMIFKSWNMRIYFIFQAFVFFYASVNYNIHYGPLLPIKSIYLIDSIWYDISIDTFRFINILIAFLGIAVILFTYSREIEVASENLENERDKSDKLLLNILPEKVAFELKESGSTEPILFNSVTVFFTDFVGFTKIAEKLPPKELVDELDKCFSYFDQVTEKYNLEKLKTIGDAFMAAGGIPVPNNTHPIDVCLGALEIQAFMNQMKEIKEQQGLSYWELRLGINTGNLVAGVVGEKKFAYDVWGDTVNTASRMESSGVSGKINISKSTYEQVKSLFDCEYRGQVAAKHKGMVDMYFLNGVKSDYSVNGEGRVPNDQFHAMYKKVKGGASLSLQ